MSLRNINNKDMNVNKNGYAANKDFFNIILKLFSAFFFCVTSRSINTFLLLRERPKNEKKRTVNTFKSEVLELKD